MSLPSAPCCSLLSSFLFVPPCYCSSSWVLLGTGYSSWLFVVLDGKGFFLPPICFHTCLLVCSQLVSLFFYLHCDSSLRVLLVKGISSSPVPLSPLLSVLRSGGFGDRTQVSSVFVLVSLLHSHMWLFSLGASGGQYAPCPLSVSVLIPLVLSNSCPFFSLSLSLSFSLSLSLFFSLGAYLDTWFSSSPICLRTCLPCSLQVVSLIASPLLFFSFLLLGCFLYLSLNCCACLCVLWDETYYPLHSLTLGHYHMLPYLTSYLSPTCLLIISPLPCFFPGHQHFGTERRVFLLFPFFPYLFL